MFPKAERKAWGLVGKFPMAGNLLSIECLRPLVVNKAIIYVMVRSNSSSSTVCP